MDNTTTQERGFPGISGRKFILHGTLSSHRDGYKKILEGKANKCKRYRRSKDLFQA